MALPAGHVLQEPPLGVWDQYRDYESSAVSIFVGSEPSSKRPDASANPDYVVGEVVVDGATFVMAEVTDADGYTTIIAGGVASDARWSIAISGPASDVERDFLRQILATFRFPASDFAPLVCAGGSAPLSLSGVGSLTRDCQVQDGRYSVTWEADGSCLFKVRFFNGGSTDVTVVRATVSEEVKRGTETSDLPSDNYSLFVEADGCAWTVDITGVP